MLQAADAQRVRVRRRLRVQQNRLWCRTSVITSRVSRISRCVERRIVVARRSIVQRMWQLKLCGVSRSVLSGSPCTDDLGGFQGPVQVFVGACRSPVEVHDLRTIPFPTGVLPMDLLDDLDPGSWDLIPCASCKTT
jgi:hypothetical protein